MSSHMIHQYQQQQNTFKMTSESVNDLSQSPSANVSILFYPIDVTLHDYHASIQGVSSDGHIQWQLPATLLPPPNNIIQGTRQMLYIVREYNHRTQHNNDISRDKIRYDRIYIHDQHTDGQIFGIPLLLFCQFAVLYRDRAIVPRHIFRPMTPVSFRATLFPTRIAASTDELTSVGNDDTTGDWLSAQTMRHGRSASSTRHVRYWNDNDGMGVDDDDNDEDNNSDMDDHDGKEIDYPDTPSMADSEHNNSCDSYDTEDDNENDEDSMRNVNTVSTHHIPRYPPHRQRHCTRSFFYNDDDDDDDDNFTNPPHTVPCRRKFTTLPRVKSRRTCEYEKQNVNNISWRHVSLSSTTSPSVRDDAREHCMNRSDNDKIYCQICFNSATELLCYPNEQLAPIEDVPEVMIEPLKVNMIANEHVETSCLVVRLSRHDHQHHLCVHCLRRMYVHQRDMIQSLLSRSLEYDSDRHDMVVQCPLACRTCHYTLPISLIQRWLLWTENEQQRFQDILQHAISLRSSSRVQQQHVPASTTTMTTTTQNSLLQQNDSIGKNSSCRMDVSIQQQRPHCPTTVWCPFFYRPLSSRQYSRDYGMYAEELTTSLCYEQMLDQVVAGSTDDFHHVTVTCPVCLQHLSKTIACNAMGHCGVEICNVCGHFTKDSLSSSSGRSAIHSGHWDPKGLRGCPRWDSDCFWKKRCHIDMRCTADNCRDDGEHECRDPVHMAAKRDMNATRLYNLLYHKFRWLQQNGCAKIADDVETQLLKTTAPAISEHKLFIIAEAARTARQVVSSSNNNSSSTNKSLINNSS